MYMQKAYTIATYFYFWFTKRETRVAFVYVD